MKKSIKKQLTTIMSVLMALAMSFALVACSKNEVKEEVAQAVEEVKDAVEEVKEAAAEVKEEVKEEVTEAVEEVVKDVKGSDAEATVVGEGAVQFAFEVVDAEGNTTLFTVNTDKATVGEALLDVSLIEGEDSEYGLYVKKVNGITADFDVDQTYWAFYVDGEYAMTGVDSTEVVAGSTYSFKVEK